MNNANKKNRIFKLYNKFKELHKNKKKFKRIVFFSIIISIIIFAFVIPSILENEKPLEIEVQTSIEKIKNKNELSTFQVTYNGISEIKDKKNPKKISYYVSYNAKIKAGFSIDQLKYESDETNKKIIITIPKITLQEPEIDISSLDYIFYDKNKNSLGVSQEAYNACFIDAKKESEKEKAIYELAKENAKNLIKALATPFVKNINEGDYKLVIK